MTVVFTPKYRQNLVEDVAHNGLGVIIGTINLGTGYATNGAPIELDNIFSGLEARALSVVIDPSADGTTLYKWDSGNAKIEAYVEDGTSKLFVEAANASDLSAATKTARITIFYSIGTAQSTTPIDL